MEEHLKTMEQLYRACHFQVLDVKDVAVLIKRCETYVRELVSKRLIPYHKNSRGNVTFLRSEVEEWMLGKRMATQEEIDRRAATYITTKNL